MHYVPNSICDIYPYRYLLFAPIVIYWIIFMLHAYYQERAKQRAKEEAAKAAAERRRIMAEQAAERLAQRMTEAASAEPPKPKRPVGRPRKNPDAPPKPKRPVGRPRKNPLPDPPAPALQAEPDPPAPSSQPTPEPPAPPAPIITPAITPDASLTEWPPANGNGQFLGQRVAFTGTLRSQSLADGMAAVARNGGTPQDHFDPATTTMLVYGDGGDYALINAAHATGTKIVNVMDFSIMCMQPIDITPEQYAAVAALHTLR